MQLLFKQRLFSWLCSYDVYDRYGETVYTVRGELGWGHCLRIYDRNNVPVGLVKQKVLTFLPKFELFVGERSLGFIRREFTWFRPSYTFDYNGWRAGGDFFEWDYTITNAAGGTVATISKQLFNWTDTYVIDVPNPNDALCALMLVLAIDAEKCSRDS